MCRSVDRRLFRVGKGQHNEEEGNMCMMGTKVQGTFCTHRKMSDSDRSREGPRRRQELIWVTQKIPQGGVKAEHRTDMEEGSHIDSGERIPVRRPWAANKLEQSHNGAHSIPCMTSCGAQWHGLSVDCVLRREEIFSLLQAHLTQSPQSVTHSLSFL